MTVSEAIEAAKNGDLGAMEALMDYYDSDDEHIVEWFQWASKAVQAGSITAAKKSMIPAFLGALSLKQNERFDLACTLFNDASQAGFKLIEQDSNLAFAIINHALYNMALIIYHKSDDPSEWERAYRLLSMGDKSELKPFLLEPYINHPCHRNREDFHALQSKLLSLTPNDFTRPDLEDESLLKKIYAFDTLDLRMVSVVYVKVADTLRDDYHDLDAAKGLLEYGASVIPYSEYASALKNISAKYKRNLFGKLVYDKNA